MANVVFRIVRWSVAGMLALAASAMYATSFSYTHPAIMFAAFLVAFAVMVAPVPFGLPRRGLAYVSYSARFAVALTLAVVAIHFLRPGPSIAMAHLPLVIVAAIPVVVVLFLAILCTGWLVPVRANSPHAG